MHWHFSLQRFSFVVNNRSPILYIGTKASTMAEVATKASRLNSTSTVSSTISSDADQILVEEGLHTATAILNRPKKLNSITDHMVACLKKLYQKWEKEENVKAVILKGNGRAFCAGGDVARVCEMGKAGLHGPAAAFFNEEYQLNYLLATLKKPHIALIDGVVMGGGNGIAIHGMFRVVTEKTVFAMPETSLGLHPDVGASFFLSRLPSRFGEYLALTGERIDGAEMLACGLATHYVLSEDFSLLENDLHNLQTSSQDVVNNTLNKFSKVVSPHSKSFLFREEAINKVFSMETVEDILLALEAKKGVDSWYKSTFEKLKKASPMSLKITLRSIREGRHQTLDQCLVREYRMSHEAVIGRVSKDFYEVFMSFALLCL
ncbi:hypothetical protein O6H91_09G029700 [Diphasiastrum complanatum]|uniref:Uncharacterized protein n=1 Tax=Diphasiastrum complanatum TaxID=34168 RepID=A0ACC2CMN1_DIPCM|nr:hypothetical protein O6H91_09G029700 [Diphasiastrum complanatum]